MVFYTILRVQMLKPQVLTACAKINIAERCFKQVTAVIIVTYVLPVMSLYFCIDKIIENI
jgi:hypothetical protein